MGTQNSINAPVSTFGKTLIDDADAATARTTLAAQQTLSGLALTDVVVSASDKVLIQDASDSDNLKTVTTQEIADIATAASAPVDSTFVTLENETGTLTGSFSLGSLTTGLVLNTVAAGVSTLSKASSTTDFYAPGGGAQVAIIDGGTGGASATAGLENLVNGATLTGATLASSDIVMIKDVSDSNKLKSVTAQDIADLAGTGAAPNDAKYIVQVSNAGLSEEQALGDLATGMMYSTTTTGVVSIAVEGTDYYKPGGTDVAIVDGGTGQSTATLAIEALVGGATLTGATVASGDIVMIQDVSAANVLRSVTAQDIADLGPGGSSAPNDAKYIVQVSNGSLTSEQALGDLATGILKSTTTTGVVSIAVAGTDYQGVDATLTSIAALGTAADKMIYTTGIDTWAESGITTAGRAILDDASASDQRTTLGLGTIATQDSSNVSITGGSVTGITDIVVADGGTGVSSVAAYQLVTGGTTSTNPLQVVSGTGTAGQFLVSAGAGALPVWSSVEGTPWVDQASTPVTMAVNTRYIANTGGLLTFNVPATAAVGTTFRVAGYGAGGWLVQFNTGQTGRFGSVDTSVAGSFASTNIDNGIEILCVQADTTFVVISSVGTITIA